MAATGFAKKNGIRKLAPNNPCRSSLPELNNAVDNNESLIKICPGEMEFHQGNMVEIDYYVTIECDVQNPADACVLKRGSGNTRFFFTKMGATFKDITFEGGREILGGGAIMNAGGNLTVDGCAFIGNENVDRGNIGGGAIYNWPENSVKVTDSTFTGNKGVDAYGGAINSYQVEVTNCTFKDNHAKGGGAIMAWRGARIEDCTFTGNNAEYGGAIGLPTALQPGTHLTIVSGRFERNKAEWVGDNVYRDTPNASAVKCQNEPIFCDELGFASLVNIDGCGPPTNCP